MAVRTAPAAVGPLAIVPAQRAANVMRALYPRLGVRVDASANALVLDGSDAELQAAKAVIQGLDVRDATKPATEAFTMRSQSALVVADKLHGSPRGAGNRGVALGTARRHIAGRSQPR